MNMRLAVALGSATLVVCLQFVPAAPVAGAENDVPDLPGITSPDPYPEGCVSCHKGTMLLKDKLQALEHRSIEGKVTIIPTDCKTCHSEEEGLDPIANIAHSMHYATGSKSDFVIKHNGSCLNCHQVATGSGEVTVKSGKKNW
ncbi:MAG: hypothetical protein E4H19_15090 [Chromatiales bacterium]|jgi:hypothetical protein|nr:MAG: hypothetical protein E4H19_15090 [Chromatiales bacterium]